MQYKCLILDHDDTSVNSTEKIHYPAYVEIMKKLRPHKTVLSLEDWFIKSCAPGIYEYFTEELKLDKKELKIEYLMWRSFTENIVPDFYPGFIDFLKKYRDGGGKVAIVSHSDSDIILRDYKIKGDGFIPDIILGRSDIIEENKPHPWPIEQLINSFGFNKKDFVLADDLQPGIEMALKTGITAIGAGWGHKISHIKKYMKKNCFFYFTELKDFYNFILS